MRDLDPLHHPPGDANANANAHHPQDLSALVDGELSDAEWARLNSEWASEDGEIAACPTWAATWHRYHVIGEAMRSQRGDAHHHNPTHMAAFARGVMQRLAQEPPPWPAAHDDTSTPATPLAQQPAANDARWRWRLASAASVAFVAVLSWNSLTNTGSSELQAQHQGQEQDHRASVAVPVSSGWVTSTPHTTADTIRVETAQGAVLRDARLEAWMHAHRHHGAGAALQAPAGFLRAATLDATQP